MKELRLLMNTAFYENLMMPIADLLEFHKVKQLENMLQKSLKIRSYIKQSETGVPQRGVVQKIQGQDMVVHRIPIWKIIKLSVQSGC